MSGTHTISCSSPSVRRSSLMNNDRYIILVAPHANLRINASPRTYSDTGKWRHIDSPVVLPNQEVLCLCLGSVAPRLRVARVSGSIVHSLFIFSNNVVVRTPKNVSLKNLTLRCGSSRHRRLYRKVPGRKFSHSCPRMEISFVIKPN
jgi:hypothetical protein